MTRGPVCPQPRPGGGSLGSGPLLPAGVGAAAGRHPDPTSSASQAWGAALPNPTSSLGASGGVSGCEPPSHTRGGGDVGLLTGEQQVCVDAVHHLRHGLGLVAEGVTCVRDGGAGRWRGLAGGWGLRPPPARRGRSPPPLLSALRCGGLAAEAQGAGAGPAGGSGARPPAHL